MSMDFGKQFARLLDSYRKPDGAAWRFTEIEDATNGFVKGSYLTNLKKGRIRQPGWDRMQAIAKVMGFPVQLWFEEPEEWRRVLDRSEAPNDGTLAKRLNLLFEVITNDRTGKPFTDREVADLSFGYLSEDEVARVRNGEIKDLKGAQYLALSEVFGVDTSYWYARPDKRPVLDQQIMEDLRDDRNQLILNKLRGRSEQEKDILLNLLDQLDLLRAESRPPESSEDDPGGIS